MRARRALAPALLAAVVTAGWYAMTYLGLDERRRFLLPPPHAVLAEGLFDGEGRGEIVEAVLATGRVALLGLVVATLVGGLLAIAMAQAPWIEHSVYPWAVVLQTVPVLAIVPLIGFWWGFDFRSRVLVCVLVSIFPIVTNTLFGLQSAAAGLHDVFDLRRAGRWTRLAKLQLPAALPAVFTGLRISAGLAVIGAIVGDFFFRQGDPGIGRLIDTYRAELASERLFAAIGASSMLGVLAFWLIGLAGHRAIGSWHQPQRGQRGQRRQRLQLARA